MSLVNGYETLYMPDHPRAMNNGMIYEHILKAEEKIGRPLKEEEVVHHKDKCRNNNSLDNLIIFATTGDHTAVHNGCEYYTDNEGISHAIPKERICKSRESKTSDPSISQSSNRERISRRKVQRPSRDEFKTLIREKSYLELGRTFGVSDKAISKWAKQYNLPFKKSDIKQYTDEEWNNI